MNEYAEHIQAKKLAAQELAELIQARMEKAEMAISEGNKNLANVELSAISSYYGNQLSKIIGEPLKTSDEIYEEQGY